MLFSFYPIFSLLTSTLILGTILSVSSNSVFMMWVGLEMNMMSFLPMILLNQHLYSSISAMKYFLTQSTASMILLLSFLSQSFTQMSNLIMLLTMMVKAGLPPYHFWFPSVMQSMNWYSCLILSTWQKMAPLIIIFFLVSKSKLFLLLILTSLFISSMGGFSQTKLRPLLAYSSIGHMSWMLSVNMISSLPAFIYLFFYILLTSVIFFFFQMTLASSIHKMFKMNFNAKTLIIISILFFSLSGLPPFTGFFLKWLVLETLMNENMLLSFFLIASSMINLSYYLNLIFCLIFFHTSFAPQKQAPLFLPFFMVLTTMSTPNIFIYEMTLMKL